MRKFATLFLCLCCLPLAALAQTAKPSEIAPYIHSDKPYGQGAYTKLWFKAYDASLWTDAPTWSMDVPFALSLRYGMHFTSDDIVKRSVDEIQHTDPLSPQEAADYTTQLSRIFPEVNEGDVITAFFTPRKGVKFFYNGKPSGTIADTRFAARFMGIWLSDKTSAPDLRKQLLSDSHN